MPTIATTVCSTLPVTEFDRGDGTFDRFMSADMSISTTDPRYSGLILYACIMVCVWVFGFPMALSTLLFSYRHAIESRISRRG